MTNSRKIQDALRSLPSVDELILLIDFDKYELPHSLITNVIQKNINNIRENIIKNDIPDNSLKIIKNNIILSLNNIIETSIQPIINGTGIVLHTGFGRAPISNEIIDSSMDVISSYCSLEFNVKKSIRGERLQYSKILLNHLLRSEDSIVVNNCAAAVLIALNTISLEKEVIISRGQQVEIGGSFRIPEVIQKSGCKMVEVGTTNRTHIDDYKNAITQNTGAILIVHPSNYKVVGFTKDADFKQLIDLSKKHNIPIILDLGSGMILDNKSISNDDIIQKYMELGFDLIMFSSDKLLGGPQAGIICGKKKIINKIHKNPLYRSLRCNKFILTMLEKTLSQYKTQDYVFKNNLTLSLLNQDRLVLRDKGNAILKNINKQIIKDNHISLVESEVEVGSGSLPTEKKPSIALKFHNLKKSSNELSRLFRTYKPAVIGYIKKDNFYLDLKAILDKDIKILSNTINQILK